METETRSVSVKPKTHKSRLLAPKIPDLVGLFAPFRFYLPKELGTYSSLQCHDCFTQIPAALDIATFRMFDCGWPSSEDCLGTYGFQEWSSGKRLSRDLQRSGAVGNDGAIWRSTDREN